MHVRACVPVYPLASFLLSCFVFITLISDSLNYIAKLEEICRSINPTTCITKLTVSHSTIKSQSISRERTETHFGFSLWRIFTSVSCNLKISGTDIPVV